MTNQAMDHLPRNERRLLLKAEARNRSSGNWGEWEVFGFAKGTVNKNQKSWAYHFDKAYRNQVFSVLENAAGTSPISSPGSRLGCSLRRQLS